MKESIVMAPNILPAEIFEWRLNGFQMEFEWISAGFELELSWNLAGDNLTGIQMEADWSQVEFARNSAGDSSRIPVHSSKFQLSSSISPANSSLSPVKIQTSPVYLQFISSPSPALSSTFQLYISRKFQHFPAGFFRIC